MVLIKCLKIELLDSNDDTIRIFSLSEYHQINIRKYITFNIKNVLKLRTT